MRTATLCCIAAFALMCALPSTSAGDQNAVPVAGDDSAVVELRLAIERLSSPERATRRSAEQSLLEAGPSILDTLPIESEISDAAVRDAIRRIRAELERRMAEESLEAGRFALVADDGSINAMLALTPAQAHRLAQGKVVADGPFWSVVDAVGRQIDGWPDEIDPDRRLTFRDRLPEDEFKQLHYAGAFRIAAGPLARRPVTGRDDQRLVRVALELRAEPRLRPLFVSYGASDVRLIDERQAELPPFSPGARYELPVGASGEPIRLHLDFLADGAVAGPFALEGELQVTLAAAEQRFVFPLDAIFVAPVEEARGGVKVRARKASRLDDGTIAVEMAVVYERGGPAFESHRTWVYHNAARLEFDAVHNGSVVREIRDREPGFSTIALANGGVVLEYRFAAPPANATEVEFVYEAPTRILDTPITFAMKNLTVPSQGQPAVNAGSAAAP